jgi:hypothetical protein
VDVQVLSNAWRRSTSFNLTPVPGQEIFWLGNGNDLSEPILDGQAVLDENTPVSFRERHAGARVCCGGFGFLPQAKLA